MKQFFESKVWSWIDIVCLKWSALLFGTIIGAFFSGFIKQNIWLILFVMVVLAIKPALKYLKQ